MYYFSFNQRLTVLFDDNSTYTWVEGEPCYQEAMDLALKSDWGKLKVLANITKEILEGNYDIKSGTVKGYTVENSLTKLIKALEAKGVCHENIQHLKPFLQNVVDNPYIDAAEELADFVFNLDTVITEDGCFLAYKFVNSNLTSVHDGKTLHLPNTWVEEKNFDTDRTNVCSKGLHFCAYDYLNCYGDGNGVIICVKVNPKDVVAIPTDYHFMKGRTCKYYVMGVIPHGARLTDEELLEKLGVKAVEEHSNVVTDEEMEGVKERMSMWEEFAGNEYWKQQKHLFDSLKEEKEEKHYVSKERAEAIYNAFMTLNNSISEVAKAFNLTPSTVNRYIREFKKYYMEDED